MRKRLTLKTVAHTKHVVHQAHDDAAHGVHGVVPVEALAHQPRQRLPHRQRITKGDLVLDDDVCHTVKLDAFAHRQVVSPVVLDDLVDPLLLVEIEPEPGS